MSQHEGHPSSADWVAQDLEQLLHECDALIESHDEQLRRLRASITDLETEREHACRKRDQARRVLETLRAAVLEGQQLRAARTQSPNPHLRIVSGSEDSSVPHASSETGTPGTSQLPPGNPVVLIEGPRSVTIMKVISSDGRRDWTARAVTDALGESADAVRRNRCVLETLCGRGVLTKKQSPSGRGNGKNVFYRLAAPWQAA
ncbi:hypothetical protein KN815_08025 [Streptomyces sp. 4503]|uniref:HTH marR-type domain-containing protein n=1 Tax=Streptomyces niphimycinicus TaxID=2842201 RepID=A0ABS6CAX0_9ACTN|nr:hypothetical protein [Streptomyces niphimycinicus]MBU3864028.1 hypothetical protein [Streptomyces niphimycinicus]